MPFFVGAQLLSILAQTMKYRLLDILRQPGTGGRLALREATVEDVSGEVPLEESGPACRYFCALRDAPPAEAGVGAEECRACYAREITAGRLVAEDGAEYPILGGIPRFVPDDLRADLKKIQATFSAEWDAFEFGQRNWGQTIEHRRGLFLEGMGVVSDNLQGKMIWDAGCGSGLLSMTMADDFGMEVVALDLAFGIEAAYRHNTNPRLHFIQGSVLEPPLRRRMFDYVYCAGVLVACPDTRAGFRAIVPMLRVGGRCMIWVYAPINEEYHPGTWRKIAAYNWIRVNVTSRLPIQFQRAIYSSLIPAFLVKQEIEVRLGRKKNRGTGREKMQALFDFFSPIYQNRHTIEEVCGWFEEEGFTNINVRDRGDYGFATHGDLASPVDS